MRGHNSTKVTAANDLWCERLPTREQTLDSGSPKARTRLNIERYKSAPSFRYLTQLPNIQQIEANTSNSMTISIYSPANPLRHLDDPKPDKILVAGARFLRKKSCAPKLSRINHLALKYT